MRSAVPRGEVLESLDTIILENVPIITPNRDEVASDLTFTVSPKLRYVLTLLCPPTCTHVLHKYYSHASSGARSQL